MAQPPFGSEALGELLPPVLVESRFLDVALWQWAGLALLLAVAWLASALVTRTVLRGVGPVARRTDAALDERLLRALAGPLRLLLAIWLLTATSYVLGLSDPAQAVLNTAAKLLTIVAFTWLVLRGIDLFGGMLEDRLRARDQSQVIALVPLGRKAVKAFVVVLAFLAALDSFGFDVTALVAGLGIGGLAVALALQKSLENLFGGVTILADRPVRVGDFCRFGDKVGVVEEIGLRSTRVRTLARTLVSVPNAEFAAMQLENFQVRDKFWYNPSIGLRYETTPDQIRFVLVEIRRMLYSHEKVDPDPARIRFERFGAYSLDLGIFAYVKAADFGEYLDVAEDLNLRIMDIVERAGTGFAFPSSTTYVARDEGLDAERSRAAEDEVRAWRERHAVHLPDFPAEEKEALAGKIPFPPEGSSLRKDRS